MKKLSIYLSMLFATFLVAGLSAGCTKDFVDDGGVTDGDIYQLEEGEYGIGFGISLPKLGTTTRASLLHPNAGSRNDIEDYVDTEHLFILFFNLDGTYLFDIKNPTAVPMGQSLAGNDNQWFIKIPVKAINPNLVKYIEEHPFKIAVLANWTINEDFNLGDKVGDGADQWAEFRFTSPVDPVTGELIYDENGKLKGDNISLLAHAERDTAYTDDRGGNENGYGHLVNYTATGPHMGPYTEWVRNYHSNQTQAEQNIRTKYNVKQNKYRNELLWGGIDYSNLWHVWHFSSDETVGYDAGGQILADWKELNAAAKESYEASAADSYGNRYWRLYSDDDFYFHGNAAWEDSGEQNGIFIPSFPDSFTEEMNDAGDSFPGENEISYAHFMARADGYVRIRYKAVGGAKLKVHIGVNNFTGSYVEPGEGTNRNHNIESRSESKNKVNRNEAVNGYFEAFGDIPNIPKQVFIYSLNTGETTGDESGEGGEDDYAGAPGIIIYEVEYIESRHLYDVDREGRMPDSNYPIPMYGIQDFDAIGEYWQPGVLFNLSTFNNAIKPGYSYRTVSLLRSLARVEVLLRKDGFPRKPSHVFLRSMNRSARITPVDFFTPTDIIWNGFDRANESDRKRYNNYEDYNIAEQSVLEGCSGVDGEIDNICNYGPIYIGSNRNAGLSSKEKLDEYRQATSWPFGIWQQQWNWNWNRNDQFNPDSDNAYMVDWFPTYEPGGSHKYYGTQIPDYPRILHPRISRSDYARFKDVTDEYMDEYYHYIIYVPEKNITDADNPGNIADRPKIVHVELRFNGGLDDSKAGDNIVDNLDDNGAYRLYFTTGGRASAAGFDFQGRQSWDAYEYEWDIVRQHWPIMRNHIYRFTVDGGGPNFYDNNITFQVEAPEKREAGWNFY